MIMVVATAHVLNKFPSSYPNNNLFMNKVSLFWGVSKTRNTEYGIRNTEHGIRNKESADYRDKTGYSFFLSR